MTEYINGVEVLDSPTIINREILKGFITIDALPGAQQVTNNTPSSATGWALGADWAYGASLFTKAVAVGTSTVSQATCVGVVNDIVEVIYTIAAGMAGTSVTMSFGGATGTARTAAGTYKEYITCTSTAALTFTPTANFVGSISTFSVKKVGVVAADRVTAWVGDRLAAGVAQAGDAGLFLRSEDGTKTFIGDRLGFGTWEPNKQVEIYCATDSDGLRITNNVQTAKLDLYTNNVNAAARNWDLRTNNWAFGDFAIVTGTTTGAAPSVARLLIAASGALLINGTVAYSDNGALFEVNKSAANGGALLSCWSTTDAERGLLEFYKSASATVGTKALVANGEAIGGILWRAADSASGWSTVASMEVYIDAAPGDNDTAGRWVVSTTADGAATPTEAIRVNSAQHIGIGQTTITALLHLKAGAAAASSAPLKFATGPLLTTPEAGAVEHLGDGFYVTPTTTVARQQVATDSNAVFYEGEIVSWEDDLVLAA